MAEDTAATDPVELATELTIAWLANPNTNASSEDVPAFLQSMHRAVVNLTAAPVEQSAAEPEYTPAVTVRRSLSSKDHIISLIDGKPYKTLRRHLSRYGLTPEQYRERYNLKPDYPIVAESYSQVRRDMAKKIGLGRKPGIKMPAKGAKAAPSAAAKPRGRPRKVHA
jgi:predicted transcriptional regulator